MLSPIQFNQLRTIPGAPAALRTLGDHIRAERLRRGELQKDVADFIGATKDTVLNWELGKVSVSTRHYPKVMEYLGYCPLPEEPLCGSLGARIRRHRVHQGLSLKEAATLIGADPGALLDWESGRRKPSKRSSVKLRKLLSGY